MAHVLAPELSHYLADLHMRLPVNDKMELIMALDDIDGGTADDPIVDLHDRRVGEKPCKAIHNLMQEYAA